MTCDHLVEFCLISAQFGGLDCCEEHACGRGKNIRNWGMGSGWLCVTMVEDKKKTEWRDCRDEREGGEGGEGGAK